MRNADPVLWCAAALRGASRPGDVVDRSAIWPGQGSVSLINAPPVQGALQRSFVVTFGRDSGAADGAQAVIRVEDPRGDVHSYAGDAVGASVEGRWRWANAMSLVMRELLAAAGEGWGGFFRSMGPVEEVPPPPPRAAPRRGAGRRLRRRRKYRARRLRRAASVVAGGAEVGRATPDPEVPGPRLGRRARARRCLRLRAAAWEALVPGGAALAHRLAKQGRARSARAALKRQRAPSPPTAGEVRPGVHRRLRAEGGAVRGRYVPGAYYYSVTDRVVYCLQSVRGGIKVGKPVRWPGDEGQRGALAYSTRTPKSHMVHLPENVLEAVLADCAAAAASRTTNASSASRWARCGEAPPHGRPPLLRRRPGDGWQAARRIRAETMAEACARLRGFRSSREVAMCEEAGNLWAMLDDMSTNDPIAYEEVIVEQGETEVEGEEMRPGVPHIAPSGCFVVKAWGKHSKVKTFINVCRHEALERPSDNAGRPVSDDPHAPTEGVSVPMAIGAMREHGATGDECFVSVDAIVHGWATDRAETDRVFRSQVVDLIVKSVEQEHSLVLDRPFKLIAATYKGGSGVAKNAPVAAPVCSLGAVRGVLEGGAVGTGEGCRGARCSDAAAAVSSSGLGAVHEVSGGGGERACREAEAALLPLSVRGAWREARGAVARTARGLHQQGRNRDALMLAHGEAMALVRRLRDEQRRRVRAALGLRLPPTPVFGAAPLSPCTGGARVEGSAPRRRRGPEGEIAFPSEWRSAWDVGGTTDNGNCFFDAVSKALGATEDQATDEDEVRAAVCCHMMRLAELAAADPLWQAEHAMKDEADYKALILQPCISAADDQGGHSSCKCNWAATVAGGSEGGAGIGQSSALADVASLRYLQAEAAALRAHALCMARDRVHASATEAVAVTQLWHAAVCIAVATTSDPAPAAALMARMKTGFIGGKTDGRMVWLWHQERMTREGTCVGHFEQLRPKPGMTPQGSRAAAAAAASVAAEAAWLVPELLEDDFQPLAPAAGSAGGAAPRRKGAKEGKAADAAAAGSAGREGGRRKGGGRGGRKVAREVRRVEETDEDRMPAAGDEARRQRRAAQGKRLAEEAEERRDAGPARAELDAVERLPAEPALRPAADAGSPTAAWAAIAKYSADEVSIAPFRALPDVPHNLRANWADTFVQVTSAVEDAIARGSDQERDDALKWRLILPQLMLRKKPQGVTRGRDYVARRFRQFAAGQYDVLLGEWHVDRGLTGAQPLRQAAGSEVPHSVKLMQQGQMSRAALHLSSAGVADPADPGVREQMCAKFPERKVGVPQRFGNVPHGKLELKEDRLCEAIRLLKPLASAGPDGMRNEYLTSLVKVQDRRPALRAVKWFGEQWVNGALPPWYVRVAMAARVAPLVKGALPEEGTPDCRPVCVGGTERRLYTSLVLREFKPHFKKLLWPLQAAIGVQSGQQLVTTAIRTALQQRSDFVVVKVDVSNAFNACTRAAMLAAIERHPEVARLLPLYAAILVPESKLWMRGTNGDLEEIGRRCAEGGHQGCSATGAAFCLAIHPAVEAADNALGACGGFARFFADDGYLVGPRKEVLEALAAFEIQVREECGLELNRKKTEWLASTEELAEVERPAMAEAGLVEGKDADGNRGIEVVGIPVGDDEYVEHFVRCKAEGAISKSNLIIQKLCPAHLQIAQVLTYYCLTPLVDYLASSLPPKAVRSALQLFDRGLLAAATPHLVPQAAADDPLIKRRLRLPARLAGGALRERGGWLADAAYAATMLRILPLMVDHPLEGTRPGANHVEEGFLADLMPELLGDVVPMKEGRFAALCNGDSQLGKDFTGAWNAVRAAADDPTAGVLSNEVEDAGLKLLSAQEMADADGVGSTEPDDCKVKEQKQITTAIEVVTSAALAKDMGELGCRDMKRVAYFSVDSVSRHWIFTPPFPGCELSSEQFQILSARYYGVPDVVSAPYVGSVIRARGSGADGKKLEDGHCKNLVNANIGEDRYRKRHDLVLRAIMAEMRLAGQEATDNVLALFNRKFGERNDESARRAAAFGMQMVGNSKQRREMQGLVPDIAADGTGIAGATDVVTKPTLFELKQVNLVAAYFAACLSQREAHAVEARAKAVHGDYVKKLHECDKFCGTACAAPRLSSGKCSYAGEWSLAGGKHGQGGGVRHLLEKYTEVQPLVFGHYGEINKTFSALIESLGRAIAARHHRPFGWKNANAGISRARAGVMRRISMAILRATAQHLLSGLDIIGPNSIYASEERRRQTSASEAEHDEYRGGAMAFDDSFARSHADSA